MSHQSASSAASTAYFNVRLATTDETIEKKISMPRSTLSAWAHNRNIENSIYIGLDRKLWPSLRRLLGERMKHQAMLNAVHERLSDAQPVYINGVERIPDVMTTALKAVRDNRSAIKRLMSSFCKNNEQSEAATSRVIGMVDQDPELQAQLRLELPSEDDLTSEEQARIWRRKLNKTGVAIGEDERFRYSTHDSPTVDGRIDLHNKLSRQTGEEGLSYYQRQQLKSGKGRRGSTSIAGAWEGVFDRSGNVTASELKQLPSMVHVPVLPVQSPASFLKTVSSDVGTSMRGVPGNYYSSDHSHDGSVTDSPQEQMPPSAIVSSTSLYRKGGMSSMSVSDTMSNTTTSSSTLQKQNTTQPSSAAAFANSPFSPGLVQLSDYSAAANGAGIADIEHLVSLLRSAGLGAAAGVMNSNSAPTPVAPTSTPSVPPVQSSILGGTDALLAEARALIASSRVQAKSQ
jgi:hypothetical protein